MDHRPQQRFFFPKENPIGDEIQMQTLVARLIEPKRQIPEAQKRFSNQQLKKLIVPVVVEQFLALLVGLVDSLMISHAGEAAVSAVSMINQLNAVFVMLFSALAGGGAVIASQYIGNKDPKNGTLAASQLLMLSTVISLAVMGIVQVLAAAMVGGLFGAAEKAVLDNAMTYLRITACSIPFLAVYNACSGVFRSMGKTRIIMKVSIMMNTINVVGNAIGVFLLKAGVAGVAYPTLLSHIFAAAVMLALVRNRENTIHVDIHKALMWKPAMARRIFRVAVPNAIENGLFQLAKVALVSIVAGFGTVQIAANGVAQNFWSMSALFSMSIGQAYITVIGQYMGAGDPVGADYYMKKLLRITALGTLVWNILIIAATPLVLQFTGLSKETTDLIFLLVLIHDIPCPLFHPFAFPLSSGLRAAGDVKYTMYAAIFATVVCRLSFSLLFAVALNMGVTGVAIAMVLDWVVKSILIATRYRSKKWQKFRLI